MTSSITPNKALEGQSEDDYLARIVGYSSSSKVSVEFDSPYSELDTPDSSPAVTPDDFSSPPRYNIWAITGIAAFLCLVFGFFAFQKQSVEGSDSSAKNTSENGEKSLKDTMGMTPVDMQTGQLRAEVAIKNQEVDMKQLNQNNAANSPILRPKADSVLARRSRPVALREKSAFLSSSVGSPSAKPLTRPLMPRTEVALSSPPPIPARPVVYRGTSPLRSINIASRGIPFHRYTVANGPERALSLTKSEGSTTPVRKSVQFALPRSMQASLPADSLPNDAAPPSLPIPPGYRPYYPDSSGGTDPGELSIARRQQVASAHPSLPSRSTTAQMVSYPSSERSGATDIAMSGAERRFLEGRPRTRVIPVGTRISANLLQSTAIDDNRGFQMLLAVDGPLVLDGVTVIPQGALIRAGVQIGTGGVIQFLPDTLFIGNQQIALPSNTFVVARRDGSPLIADRIVRDGSGGNNVIPFLVDTGSTLLPMLFGGNGSGNAYRDFYNEQRLMNYANRNFANGQDKANRSGERGTSPSAVYFRLPADVDVQLIAISPVEIPF